MYPQPMQRPGLFGQIDQENQMAQIMNWYAAQQNAQRTADLRGQLPVLQEQANQRNIAEAMGYKSAPGMVAGEQLANEEREASQREELMKLEYAKILGTILGENNQMMFGGQQNPMTGLTQQFVEGLGANAGVPFTPPGPSAEQQAIQEFAKQKQQGQTEEQPKQEGQRSSFWDALMGIPNQAAGFVVPDANYADSMRSAQVTGVPIQPQEMGAATSAGYGPSLTMEQIIRFIRGY